MATSLMIANNGAANALNGTAELESVVPPQITAELTQILSNLVLGDNEIRSNAEKAVNERLAHTPELYLLALAQFAIKADTEVMRSFSLVLLRRLLFRTSYSNQQPNTPTPSTSQSQPPPSPSSSSSQSHTRVTLYDHLSHSTLSTLERLLLHTLSHEGAHRVRRDAVDTICDLANQGMMRGRPWHNLQAQAFALSQNGLENPPPSQAFSVLLRESAFRVFAGSPNLILDLQVEAVVRVLQKGLQDPYSITVRHAALLASVSYLSAAEAPQVIQAANVGLVVSMLDTLPFLAGELQQQPLGSDLMTSSGGGINAKEGAGKMSNYQYLSTFLSTLTPLCTTHPMIFAPHLQTLLSFLPPLILPVVDSGPTPTVSRPFPKSHGGGGGGAFVFPPVSSSDLSLSTSHIPTSITNGSHTDEDEDELALGLNDERSTLRLTALEFMLSLTEARPSMVKKIPGWCEIMVRACLEGMGEFDFEGEEKESLESWLREEPSSSNAAETDSPPALYEQSLDRLALALGGKTVLPPAFQLIPSMLANFDWRSRHAGLMAIAAIAEGTGKVMLKELDKIVDMVTPMFQDTHPRVRYAACQCVGQLCSDLEENMQGRYHQKLLGALISTLDDPEPRVHAHAAAALINFCEGVERDTLLPYLDALVSRLFKLLNPDSSSTSSSSSPSPSNPSSSTTQRYVQEQAITTLAMVADASEMTFAKYYGTIMPLLLNVLRNAEGVEYAKLRAKAMECAGLVAIAVGPEVFREDVGALVEVLVRIQQSPQDPNDTFLAHYLMSTWAKVCQAMGADFEPYLPVVMPALLTVAGAKADLNVMYDDDDIHQGGDDEDMETIVLDGQTYGVRTSVMDDKCQAFETLVIYCSTLGARFAPYLSQSLEVTLPCLKFYFHEGVREACAMLIPMLLSCGSSSNTLTTQMVHATFIELINCINAEQDATFLASLYRYFGESLRVIGGKECLAPEFCDGIMEATKRQLHAMAERRKGRVGRVRAAAAAASSGISSGSGSGSIPTPSSSGGVGINTPGLVDVDQDELALLEEIEDYALEEVAKMLVMFDGNHSLLYTVSGVKELGVCTKWDSEEEDEDG